LGASVGRTAMHTARRMTARARRTDLAVWAYGRYDVPTARHSFWRSPMADTKVRAKMLPGAYAPPMPQSQVGGRIVSLDIVRGVIMILMAIDHVRVYSGVPAGGPTPGVFFTRWITHFVAPGFVFLAGTSAYLHGLKLADRRALSKFLVTRGAWLV